VQVALKVRDRKHAAGSGSIGNLFIIDARCWRVVHALNDLNAAVAYLVLTRFSDHENRLTNASTDAVEKYTQISRRNARKAIDRLIAAGVIEQTSKTKKPRYHLRPAYEVPGTGVQAPSGHPRLDDTQRSVLEMVYRGDRLDSAESACAEFLLSEGWITRDSQNSLRVTEQEGGSLARKPIFLPNDLVSGEHLGSRPLELIRQTQDLRLLGFLLYLYGEQNLRDDGGVPRALFWQDYERVEVARMNQYVVWGFRPRSKWAMWGDSPVSLGEIANEAQRGEKTSRVRFLQGLKLLEGFELLEWVPYLVEGKSHDAELVHPVGMGRTASIEDRVGLAAHEAGCAFLTEQQRDRTRASGLWLLPARHHLPDIQVIGIARLHFRVDTRPTAQWVNKLQDNGEKWICGYNDLERAISSGGSATVSAGSRQRAT
jgi:hypothetical protein